MPKNGHAPGHVRETACAAFEAWLEWTGEGAEPTVEYEINYEPRQIPISQALGLVWNCTDMLPSEISDPVREALHFDDLRGSSYAACARAVLASMKAQQAQAT